VVGDDPHPHVVVVVGAVPLAAQLGRPLDDRVDLVDLVQVVDALQEDAIRSRPMPVSMFFSGSSPRGVVLLALPGPASA
jgi:hypothetical protein